MKKNKLITLIGCATTFLGLISVSSCGAVETSTDSTTETTTVTENNETTTEDLTKVDITATCKMSKTPSENKTFMDNGIEEATIVKYTDGDTTTVKLKNTGQTIAIRYLSIDTPESTAGYDKWGKAASVNNKEILSKATQIVVEAQGSKAETDSNGTRYMAYIWYKTADSTEWRNLNLETVEMGYSRSTCDTKDQYYEYFEKAEQKASKLKLKIFGDEDDIYYSEDVTPVTLKQLTQNPDDYYDQTTEIPKCVEFDAYVVAISTGSYRTVTVEQLDEDGKYYQYEVSLGYAGPRIYTLSTLGSYLHYVGWTTGSGSIHGCVANLGEKTGIYSYRYSQNYYKNFTEKTKLLSAEEVDGKIVFKILYNREVEYTITCNDPEATMADFDVLIGQYIEIKFFVPNNNVNDDITVGFINKLSDII